MTRLGGLTRWRAERKRLKSLITIETRVINGQEIEVKVCPPGPRSIEGRETVRSRSTNPRLTRDVWGR